MYLKLLFDNWHDNKDNRKWQLATGPYATYSDTVTCDDGGSQSSAY